ncbi:uncharacterized protein LOC110845998 [Folsomia candida]|uniref:uncharacterized protein LOC110845998 n=1 Tax=Folsomia candida TaxID=158441 RepID=UPI001604F88E|nr:uncharacterized protein LOC110845998 [Folsomia candida]XP_035701953.1 uncharacterized protein LOC110845998 [Folsomia candida]XP_035701954.1 uncharacterized protein LOC110845998 [Folsomia candida]XP_035701955.1 uncharacterized protein LOC110845998 [Folsomia candida]
MESYSRVRSVKLGRSNPEAPFGFSVRGGHEHGTGIFVSCVNPRSVAYRQGLKVGDQILRVNGFPVSAAVHHECLALMRLRPSLHLKVRSVGMLPVKEKAGDALSWKLVEEQEPCGGAEAGEAGSGSRGMSRLSDTSSHSLPDSVPTEAKVFIDMSGRNGLGCCICKGPVERPGIFVQSTKAGGVAREAGLRPGDQLLSCNGHSFLHVPFAEAVQQLKVSPQLRLRVLKGVASDLFPGESSSGYNSSASSLNGDQGGGGGGESSKRRLHRVSEEQQHQMNGNHHQHQRPVPSSSSMHLDQGMAWDEVEQVWRSAERETILIEVKGGSSTSSSGGCNGDKNVISDEQRLLAEERRKLEETQRRLLEEALKLEEEKRRFQEEKRHLMLNSGVGSGVANGGGSNGVGAESTGSNSLVGALNQEILKRVERRESEAPLGEDETDQVGLDGERLPRPGTVEAKRTLFNAQIDVEKRQQHEQLIEEFKRAHRKMFAPGEPDLQQRGDSAADSADAAAAELIRSRRVQKELDHERQMVAQRVAGIVRQRQLRIERQHQESAETEREIRCKSPPPPPPMPAPDQQEHQGPGSSSNSSNIITTTTGTTINSNSNNPTTKKAPAPPIPTLIQPKRVIIEERSGGSNSAGNRPITTTTTSTTNNKGKAPPPPQRGGSVRPESPSPDYSNSPSPTPTRHHNNAGNKPRTLSGVDMQSLESFRLKDPPRSPKKPPPVYFPHGNNNPMMKQQHHNQQTVQVHMSSSSSNFVEGNNAKNEALSGILKGAKTISFLDKY